MNPTPQQLAAFKSTSPLTFVIAGAGSGKTRTLIWRIQHLIEHLNVDPSQIVSITFTNAAAKEIQERIEERKLGKLGFIGTLHSFMLRLLRENAHLVGYKPTINVLDEEESESFRVKIEADLKYNGTQAALTEAIAKGPPPANERLSKERLVAAAYYKALKSANLMTFDSILIYGRHLLQTMKSNYDNPQKLSRSYDLTHPTLDYDHFLIDECQDSSKLDFEIYGSLVGDRYFTGDTDQAIFGWRGGDVAQCLKIASVSKVFLLEENFRCGERICEAAQRLIEHNKTRYPKTTMSRTGFPGAVEVRSYSDPNVEAAGIANTIANTDIYRDQIAVLVRTNDLVKEYANHLRSVGIPISERIVKERPQDFWKAKLLLAFLNNPDDDYVAEKWLNVSESNPAVKEEIRTSAAKQFTTINQYRYKLPNNLSTYAVAAHLGVSDISNESGEMICKLAERLPNDSTIADLILAIGSQDEGEEIGHGVTVTTIHASKGREWSLVFLPAFEQQIIPSERKSMDLEEERRLAYVAMTRAKSSLVISHARVRVPKFGRPVHQATVPSQFIAEAGL